MFWVSRLKKISVSLENFVQNATNTSFNIFAFALTSWSEFEHARYYP